MRIKFKFLVVMVVVLAVFWVTSASSTITKFKTGPFTVSVDLGVPCNDTNLSEPKQVETLSGISYTRYKATACNTMITFSRFDIEPIWSADFGTDEVRSILLGWGADKDTISVYDQTIDGKSGAVGSGYVPKEEESLYCARFYVSPKSVCWIYIRDNETMMISALKTITVAEAA